MTLTGGAKWGEDWADLWVCPRCGMALAGDDLQATPPTCGQSHEREEMEQQIVHPETGKEQTDA